MPQKYTNLSSLFTDIADAIREKKRTSESIVADDFPDEISSIEGEDLETDFIMQTINPETFSHVTAIGDYVFIYNSKLTSVNCSQVTTIGNHAFEQCDVLRSAIFSQATTIGKRAFNNCRILYSISFPQATTIGNQAFFYCEAFRSVIFPQATAIESQAFYACHALTLASFPKVFSIGDEIFNNCYNLTSVILGGQQSREGVIYSKAFYGCYNLTDLHLQGSYLYSLSNSNAFLFTPIGGYSASARKFGSIYVPASLYNQYISATNWTYFSSRFVSIQ